MNSYIKRVLTIFVISQGIALLIIGISLFAGDGFPAPFFYVKSDSLMDFFHTNYWAFNDGRYTEWQAIYPLTVFVIAKFISNTDCINYLIDAFQLRECALKDICYLIAAYFLGMVICFNMMMRQFNAQKLSIAGFCFFLALFFSLPGMFALERGNYLLLAFLFLVLSEFFISSVISSFFLALAISIKPYLLILLVAYMFKRNYRYLIQTASFFIFLQVLSLAIIDEIHYSMILENIMGFATSSVYNSFEKTLYSTSVITFIKAISYKSWTVNFSYGWILDALRRLYYFNVVSVLIYVVSLMANWRLIDFTEAKLFFLIAVMVLSDSLGGYSLILLLPYFSKMANRQNFQRLLPLGLLLFTTLDFKIGPYMQMTTPIFFGDGTSSYVVGLTIGSYFRPLILIILLNTIAYPWFKIVAKNLLTFFKKEVYK